MPDHEPAAMSLELLYRLLPIAAIALLAFMATRRYYGWRITAAAFVIIWMTNGLTLAGLQVFDRFMMAELGVPRGVLKDRDSIILLVSAFFAPLGGSLADRFGVRPVMCAGALLGAAGLFGYSLVDDPIEMRLASVLCGLCLAGAGLVLCVTIVSRWFVARRGLALGIMLAGTSLGNTLFPQINNWLIEAHGWRDAMQIVALLPLLLLPLIVVVLREWPADLGLTPPGVDSRTAAVPRASAVEQSQALRAALRSSNFWLLALVAASTFYVILGITANIFLHLTDLGFDAARAADAFAYLFMLGLVGKLTFGWVADRLGRKRVFVTGLLVMLVGTLLLASMARELVWPALVLIGLGWGGLYTLLQLLTADIFGTRALGRILGTLVVIDATGGALGQKLTGMMYDATGSYALPFALIVGLAFIATAAALLLRVPPRDGTA